MKNTLQLLIFLLCIPVLGQYSPNVKNDAELDLFLLRIAHRYALKLPESYFSKPMHASELLAFLDQVDSLDNQNVLTAQESYRLKQIRRIISGQRSLFKWNTNRWETHHYLNLSLIGKIAPYYQRRTELQAKGIINPRFSGMIGKFSYFSEVNVWTELCTDTMFYPHDYQPFHGNAYNLYGRDTDSSHLRSSDLFRAGISYEHKHIDIETAVDNIRQGPAVYYPLTFSGQTSPLLYFRMRMHCDLFQYIHTFGQLKTQKDKPKFFYTHRLNIPLLKNRLTVGINEVIINGSTAEKAQTDSLKLKYYGEERTWEWVYMIPFIPFAFAEHYVGDRDNAMISFDFSLAIPRGFRWYGEFFLDDISSPFTIFSDDFGNKWALTAGGQFFGTLFDKDITVTAEYSRVEPWVYTHFYGGSHRYTHYGQCLGSPLGPNADAVIVSAEYALNHVNSAGIFLKNTRYNGTQRGGSITHVFQSEKSSKPDSTKKTFLGKNYNRAATIGILWKFSPFGRFHVTTESTYDSESKIGVHVFGGFDF